ncbi:MAG: hypothetical protein JNM66_21655 [Bryobacterales bacterium]|nr:hypothetical protein [Bryobacterales bacterium]
MSVRRRFLPFSESLSVLFLTILAGPLYAQEIRILGDGTSEKSVAIGSIPGVAQLAVPPVGDHLLALDDKGAVHEWRRGHWQILDVPTDVRKVAAGAEHTLLLTGDGSVWAAGDNRDGQLGNGAFTRSPRFSRIAADRRFVDLAAGSHFSLALDDEGNVWAWGANWTEIVLSDSRRKVPHPARVSGLRRGLWLATRADQPLLGTADGVWSWGSLNHWAGAARKETSAWKLTEALGFQLDTIRPGDAKDLWWPAPANPSRIARPAETMAALGWTVAWVADSRAAVTLPGPGRLVSAAAGTGTLAVVADQSWTATSSASWLTVTPAGSGSQSLSFSYSANSAPAARVATIRVAGQPYTVTQAASNGVYTPWGAQNLDGIKTLAGNGVADYFGDGGDATAARLSYPNSVAIDDNGNVFVSDQGNHMIRRISADSGLISGFAGSGTQGFLGDGGQASVAQISGPAGLAIDRFGNLYFADSYNHRIRRVAAATGVITTVAGTGVAGGSGDEGLATAAQLNTPAGIAVDADGNIYIADQYNSAVRKVDAATGIIRTLAGGGVAGFSGDGGPAAQAQLRLPQAVAVAKNGDVYIADTYNFRIRRIDGLTGTISTIAGRGASDGFVSDTLATLARLGDVASLAIDADSNLYFIENYAAKARVIRQQTGVISTLAGTGTSGFSGDNGPARLARLNSPAGIAVDAGGNLYVADAWNHRLRFIRVNGPTIAFPTSSFVANAAASSASITFTTTPADSAWTATSSAAWLTIGASSGTGGATLNYSLAANPGFATRTAEIAINGKTYSIRQRGAAVTLSASSTTVRDGAGSGSFTVGVSPATPWAPVSTAPWLTVAATGNNSSGTVQFAYTANPLQVARMATILAGNRRFLVLQSASNGSLSPWGAQNAGTIRTIAGNGFAGYGGDNGPAAQAQLGSSSGLALDGNGNLYTVDSDNHVVRKVAALSGLITTIAGTGIPGFADGTSAATSQFFSPKGIAADPLGNLYVADTGNNRIRRIDATTGAISTVAGSGVAGYSGDGGPAASSQLYLPESVAIDAGGNLFVGDRLNHRIRRIQAGTGIITTVAGSGVGGYGGDGVPAETSAVNFPGGLAIDGEGNLLFADGANYRVRRVDFLSGLVSTVAGTGELGVSGDGGAAIEAKVNVYGVAFDAAGNTFLADPSNDRVRRIDGATAFISTFAGTGTGGYSGDGAAASAAMLLAPFGVALDGAGSLYVADIGNSRVRYVQASPHSLPPPQPPQLVSAVPSSSTSITETFTILGRDLSGATGLQRIYFLVGDSPQVQTNSCHGFYDRVSNTISLFNDGLTATLAPIVPGTSATLGNSQCVIDPAASSANQSGSDLQLVLRISRQGAYATGAKTVYFWVVDNANAGTGWIAASTWTLGAAQQQPPTVASAAPATSSAATQVFSITARDPNGFADLSRVYFLVNDSPAIPSGSCHGFYDRATNSILLYNDALSAVSGPITPGTSGTVQNSQCAINGASSSVTASGTDLVLNLNITRQGGYATGAKTLYFWVVDNANAGTGWIAASAWTLGAAQQQPPTVASVTPSASSTITQTFSATTRDPNGFADLSRIYFLLNDSPTIPSGSCHGFYDRATNSIVLYNDALSAVSAPITPSTSGTVQNSQCAINSASSSVTASGTDLVLNLNITRQGAYATGAKTVYFWVVDNANAGTGWVAASTWTLGAAQQQPPILAAATPSASSTVTQTFSATARDPNGFADLSRIYFLVNDSPTIPSGSCHGFYDRATNSILLYNDALSAVSGPITPGTSGTVQNSQCAVNGASSSVTASGTDLVLNLNITRQGAYATGAKTLYFWVVDNANAGTGWIAASTWTLGVAQQQPPTVASVTPSASSTITQTFSATTRDPNGFADLSRIYFLLNDSPTIPSGSCHGFYDRATNSIVLYNDALSAVSAPITPGTSGTVQNSQCAINGAASSVTSSGTDLVLNLNITRQGAYATGAKTLYFWVVDNAGAGTGWIAASTWTLGAAQQQPPSVASVTPATSSAATQLFTITSRDPNGFADVSKIYFLVNTGPSIPSGSCHGLYDRATNSLLLYNDALTAVSSPLSPGTAGVIQNSQCAIDGATSSVTASGTDLMLNLSVTRQGAYSTGAKTLYIWVVDSANNGTGWVPASTWTR